MKAKLQVLVPGVCLSVCVIVVVVVADVFVVGGGDCCCAGLNSFRYGFNTWLHVAVEQIDYRGGFGN